MLALLSFSCSCSCSCVACMLLAGGACDVLLRLCAAETAAVAAAAAAAVGGRQGRAGEGGAERSEAAVRVVGEGGTPGSYSALMMLAPAASWWGWLQVTTTGGRRQAASSCATARVCSGSRLACRADTRPVYGQTRVGEHSSTWTATGSGYAPFHRPSLRCTPSRL